MKKINNIEYDILFFAHFMGDLEKSSNNRFIYIMNKLQSEGANVLYITSNFSHQKKNPYRKSGY